VNRTDPEREQENERLSVHLFLFGRTRSHLRRRRALLARLSRRPVLGLFLACYGRITPCYGPVIVPVILLSLRMSVFSEAAENKCLLRCESGPTTGDSPFFSLLTGKVRFPKSIVAPA